MKTSSLLSILTICCILFLRCSSAKNLPEQDNNDLERLLKRLQKDPGDTRSVDAFTAAYQKLQQQRLALIKDLEKDGSALSTEAILKEYNLLQQLYLSVESIPGLPN